MAVTATEFPKCVQHAIDYLTGTIKIALVESYTFDVTHEFFSDVSSTQITGTGYTAGGVTLTSFTDSYDSGTNTYTFTCDNAVWTTATFTTSGAILYSSTGVAGTSPLIGYIDFGADQSPASSDFSLRIAPAGLITRQVVAAS